MERNEVSRHEVAVVAALRAKPDQWFTNRELAASAAVAERTARLHTQRLVNLGLLEVAEVFPAHHYRWATAEALAE